MKTRDWIVFVLYTGFVFVLGFAFGDALDRLPEQESSALWAHMGEAGTILRSTEMVCPPGGRIYLELKSGGGGKDAR